MLSTAIVTAALVATTMLPLSSADTQVTLEVVSGGIVIGQDGQIFDQRADGGTLPLTVETQDVNGVKTTSGY